MTRDQELRNVALSLAVESGYYDNVTKLIAAAEKIEKYLRGTDVPAPAVVI